MSKLLSEIYEKVISEESAAVKLEKQMNEEVKRLTAPYAEKFNQEEMEQLINMVFCATLPAQEVGFAHGVWFALRLAKELVADD